MMKKEWTRRQHGKKFWLLVQGRDLPVWIILSAYLKVFMNCVVTVFQVMTMQLLVDSQHLKVVR